MKEIFYNNYKELIDLIPSIQEAALKGVNRDRITHVYNTERIRRKARLYKEIFELLQGKWTVEIFYTIMMYTECGFNDIKRALPNLNSRTLTDRLQFLEKRRIIVRTIKNERPIRVNYKLTDFGKEGLSLLVPFLLYLTLPRRFKKNQPTIKKIEEDVNKSLDKEINNLQKLWNL